MTFSNVQIAVILLLQTVLCALYLRAFLPASDLLHEIDQGQSDIQGKSIFSSFLLPFFQATTTAQRFPLSRKWNVCAWWWLTHCAMTSPLPEICPSCMRYLIACSSLQKLKHPLSQCRDWRLDFTITPHFKWVPFKSILTGGVPSFGDVLTNFGGRRLTVDNWVQAAKNSDKRIAFYGDDTWLAMFGGIFMRAEGTTSFFVADYTEV